MALFPDCKSTYFTSCRHFLACPHTRRQRTGLECVWSPNWPQGPLSGPSVRSWSRCRKRCRNCQKPVRSQRCYVGDTDVVFCTTFQTKRQSYRRPRFSRFLFSREQVSGSCRTNLHPGRTQVSVRWVVAGGEMIQLLRPWAIRNRR